MKKIKFLLTFIVLLSCQSKINIKQEALLNYPPNEIGLYFYQIFKTKDEVSFSNWKVDTYFGTKYEKTEYTKFSNETNKFFPTIVNSKFEYATFGDVFYHGRFVKELVIHYTDLNTNYKYIVILYFGNNWNLKGGKWNSKYTSDKFYLAGNEYWGYEK
jgi:hypothetical protein